MAVRHIGAGKKVKRDKYGRFAPKKGGIKPFKNNLEGRTRKGAPNKGPRSRAIPKEGRSLGDQLFGRRGKERAFTVAASAAIVGYAAFETHKSIKRADAHSKWMDRPRSWQIKDHGMSQYTAKVPGTQSGMGFIRTPGSSATIHIMAGYRNAKRKGRK